MVGVVHMHLSVCSFVFGRANTCSFVRDRDISLGRAGDVTSFGRAGDAFASASVQRSLPQSEGSCAAAAQSVVDVEGVVSADPSMSDGSCAASAHKVSDSEGAGVIVVVGRRFEVFVSILTLLLLSVMLLLVVRM